MMNISWMTASLAPSGLNGLFTSRLPKKKESSSFLSDKLWVLSTLSFYETLLQKQLECCVIYYSSALPTEAAHLDKPLLYRKLKPDCILVLAAQ